MGLSGYRPSRLGLVASLVLLVGVSSRPALAQSDEDRATARTWANQGAQAYDEGRYADCVDLFTRAEALVHAPPHLLYVARANAKLGKLVKAYEAYVRITREELPAGAPRAFADARAAAADEQKALDGRIPSLKIVVDGPGSENATVTMDGVAVPKAAIGIARPVDPGAHALEARSDRSGSGVVKITLAEGAAQTIPLPLHPVAVAAGGTGDGTDHTAGTSQTPEQTAGGDGAGSSTRTAAWIALGVGAAGLVAGTVFVFVNRNDRTSANALCSGPGGVCPPDKKNDVTSLDSSADTAATVAWIGYGVGVAAAATGAALLIFGGPSKAAVPTASRVEPWIGAGSAGIRGRF